MYTGTLSTPEKGAGRPVQIHVMESPEQEVVIERSRIVRMTRPRNASGSDSTAKLTWE